MPRSKSDWDAWFARREKKKNHKTKKPEKPLHQRQYFAAGVVGETWPGDHVYQQSYIKNFAKYRKRNPTPAESELCRILNQVNGGILRESFCREHIISGKWIVDFFFPEVRLAIEVDGSIHSQEFQRRRDDLKDFDAARFDITLLRVLNSDVFGDRELLLKKLRQGWKLALSRENKLIGKPYQE